MENYISKRLFVGIDVHKNSYTVVVMNDQTIIKKVTIPADQELLTNFLFKQYKGSDIFSAYEAGFSGFHLHRHLLEKGINNIVVHPASIEIAARDRVKTDKRDACKIAQQLAAGRLHSVYIPTKEREGKRTITRLRNQLSEARKRISCQIKSLLHQHGAIKAGDTRKVSKKWIRWVLSLELNSDVQYCLQMLTEEWLNITKKMKEVEEKITCHSIEDDSLIQIYQSVPGIGPYTAKVLLNELGDMSQFKNQKKLFSFTGLTPCEYSSGEHRRQGHISRQGRSLLRKLLIQSAWVAIKKDAKLNKKFNDLSKRTGKKRAIVAVGRILAGKIRACILSQAAYEAA